MILVAVKTALRDSRIERRPNRPRVLPGVNRERHHDLVRTHSVRLGVRRLRLDRVHDSLNKRSGTHRQKRISAPTWVHRRGVTQTLALRRDDEQL